MRLNFAPMSATQRDFALVALPALAALCICFFIQILNDGDTYWHLAAGAWMTEHRQIPHTDPFSYTFAGMPWVSHEWLSEIIMAQVYAWAGWKGLMLFTGGCFATLVGLMAWEIRRKLGPLGVIVTMICVFALIAPGLLVRPHVLALPVLALWTICLLRARERGVSPPLWLAPVMLVWANLHGSYVMGLVVAAVLALEALVEAPKEDRVQVVVRWGAFGLLSGLMCLVTPHGLNGILFPFQIMSMTSLPHIDEWKSIDFSTLGAFELVLLITLYVGFSRGVKVSPLRLLFLLLLLHMTLQHRRQEMMLAVLAPLFLAEPLARAFRQEAPTLVPIGAHQRAVLIGVTAALGLGIAGARLMTPFSRGDSENTPVTALSSLPAAVTAQPVFNEYGFGGWLILKGVRPFIDGRADMYGDAFVGDHVAAARGDMVVFERLRAKYGIRWTIINPKSGLARALDTSPVWRRAYQDKWAVVHVHQPD